MGEDKSIHISFEDGESISFRKLFKDNFAKLCVFASKFITDKTVCEDIVQDTFLKIWESENETYASVLSLTAFMYKTVRNKSLNHIKHLKIRDKYSSDTIKELESEQYFLKNVINEETNYLLYKAIQTLTPQCREVINMHLKGLKNKEIAEDLGLTVATVKTHKMAAYKQLRNDLRSVMILITLIKSSKN